MRDKDRSVCFDGAAEYYDDTRSLPAVGRDRVIQQLVTRLQHDRLCLDIGVGTGRTAVPLVAAGVRVFGIDLSIPMMVRARDKAVIAHVFLPLAAADATRLPFANNVADSALIIHVLHSVPRWETVITEAVRVVRPGGTLIVDTGDGPTPVADEIEARFVEELGGHPSPTAWTQADLDHAFDQLGCGRRRLPQVQLNFYRAPSEILSHLASGRASWQWNLDPTKFAPAAERVSAWATAKYGALDKPRLLSSVVAMTAYDVP
jgi:SAM-dependent methyltransferase